MKEVHADLVILGGGPGGYTAAFRAADLGKKVVIIEKENKLGGVCLTIGCIPSKTLLHAADSLRRAKESSSFGIAFSKPGIDIDVLRKHTNGVVKKLTDGLSSLAVVRKIERIHGSGRFINAHSLSVQTGETDETTVTFNHCIVAAGSRPVEIPGIPYSNERIWGSTEALSIPFIPPRLVVIGGGIIGLEMAAVYHELGSIVTVVEMSSQLIPAADEDVVNVLYETISKRYEAVYTKTAVTDIDSSGKHLVVSLSGKKAPQSITADAVLVAVGRRPNSDSIGIENTGIVLDTKGFIPVDSRQQTNIDTISAVGDICGNPMLAHKASHQGKVAAEVVSGVPSAFTPMTIPSVSYTSPQLAWMGMTEKEAKKNGIRYDTGTFPWTASGRALSESASEGFTKVLFDRTTKRIIGGAIAGENAGELIGELVLAMEMGADAVDISRTIHAHPTLSETIGLASEIVEGSITDLFNASNYDTEKRE